MVLRLFVREAHLVIPAPIHPRRVFIARTLLGRLHTQRKTRHQRHCQQSHVVFTFLSDWGDQFSRTSSKDEPLKPILLAFKHVYISPKVLLEALPLPKVRSSPTFNQTVLGFSQVNI
jgi:hypothetical protein